MNDWLADRARATPGRTAVVNASSGNRWDFGTLDETVDEMAGRLSALGVDRGDHLGAVLGTCVEHVALVHAAMRIGAVLVPLSPEFTAPELGDRLDRADVTTVVCSETTESTVVTAVGREAVGESTTVVTIDDPRWDGVTALSEAERADIEPADWQRPDPQLLMFTSGTTGTPKAVVLTMGNLLASAIASAFRLGVTPGDSWLVPLSLHHMGGIAPVLRTTLYGSTVVVRDEFDPGGTVDDVVEFDVTGVSLVPTMLRRMLDARGTLPDTLRFVLVGGAPTPPELVERCRNFRVPVCPTWGMTETASQIATARPEEAFDDLGTVGQPLLWTRVTVLGDEGEPLGPDEPGELVVDGPTVSPGYYGDDERTEAAYGEYGLHTGDVGYRDEAGRVHVLNRLDDRIVSGGENVDPGEVAAVLEAHPEVDAAAVVGLPDEEWGERVAALVVPALEEPALADLEAFCRERLAGFKLPRTIGIEDELPRTVSGTVDRVAVQDRLRDGPVERLEDLTDRIPDEAGSGAERDAGEVPDRGIDRVGGDETDGDIGDDVIHADDEVVDADEQAAADGDEQAAADRDQQDRDGDEPTDDGDEPGDDHDDELAGEHPEADGGAETDREAVGRNGERDTVLSEAPADEEDSGNEDPPEAGDAPEDGDASEAGDAPADEDAD